MMILDNTMFKEQKNYYIFKKLHWLIIYQYQSGMGPFPDHPMYVLQNNLNIEYPKNILYCIITNFNVFFKYRLQNFGCL